MLKWLSIELSLLLLVSLVAVGGLVGTSFGNSENSGNDFGGNAVTDLSGYATASPSTTSTGLYNGLGQKVIDLGALTTVDGIQGQTCFYHKKTGDYYRFIVTGSVPSGNVAFTKEYPQSPNWFGGKGGKCEQINLDLKGTPQASKITITGVNVKGSPNVYNNKFDAILAPTPPVPTPSTLSPQQKQEVLDMFSNAQLIGAHVNKDCNQECSTQGATCVLSVMSAVLLVQRSNTTNVLPSLYYSPQSTISSDADYVFNELPQRCNSVFFAPRGINGIRAMSCICAKP